VYALVRRIPPGRVMTYGSIAAQLPAPPRLDPFAFRRIRARWVGYAMAAAPDDVPWQRVVNARGQVSPRPGFGAAVQRARLRQEGVRFRRDGSIDLARFAWVPRPTGAKRG
jgi:methylated-DNA-protein-cysteine methyltransferase-like protein